MQGPHIGTGDGLTFISHGVLILGGNQEVFNGFIILEVVLYAIFATDLHHVWDRVLFNTHGLKIKGMYKILGIPSALFHGFYGACSENTLV